MCHIKIFYVLCVRFFFWHIPSTRSHFKRGNQWFLFFSSSPFSPPSSKGKTRHAKAQFVLFFTHLLLLLRWWWFGTTKKTLVNLFLSAKQQKSDNPIRTFSQSTMKKCGIKFERKKKRTNGFENKSAFINAVHIRWMGEGEAREKSLLSHTQTQRQAGISNTASSSPSSFSSSPPPPQLNGLLMTAEGGGGLGLIYKEKRRVVKLQPMRELRVKKK